MSHMAPYAIFRITPNKMEVLDIYESTGFGDAWSHYESTYLYDENEGTRIMIHRVGTFEIATRFVRTEKRLVLV